MNKKPKLKKPTKQQPVYISDTTQDFGEILSHILCYNPKTGKHSNPIPDKQSSKR